MARWHVIPILAATLLAGASLVGAAQAQPDPGVQRQHTVLVGQQRVDVQFNDRRQVAGQLRRLQQGADQRFLVDAAPAAMRRLRLALISSGLARS